MKPYKRRCLRTSCVSGVLLAVLVPTVIAVAQTPDAPPPQAEEAAVAEEAAAAPTSVDGDAALAAPAVSAPEPAPVAPTAPAVAAPATPETPATPEPAAPAAPPPLGLVPTGSFFGRYEARANYDKLGVSRARFIEGDAIFYRARLGLATTPIPVADGTNVTLQLSPQAASVMGTLANTVTDAAFNLHEGYLRVATSAVRFDVGRFELNYGESLVIGSLDWHEVGRSFDGMRLRVAPEGPTGYYVDFFATQVDEGRPDVTMPFAGGDHYFVGVYAGLGPVIATGLDLDVYALAQVFPTAEGIDLAPMDPMNAPSTRESAAEGTLGARVKQSKPPTDRLGAR